MKTQDALKRLSFTISKGNRPNDTDKEAFNQILRDFKKQSEETVQENRLLAKLYAHYLCKYDDIQKSNKAINKILSTPLENHLYSLLLHLKHENLNNYFNSKDIFDPLLNKENYERYKDLFPEISSEGMKYAWEAWNEDNLKLHFEHSFNQSIINFKNHD